MHGRVPSARSRELHIIRQTKEIITNEMLSFAIGKFFNVCSFVFVGMRGLDSSFVDGFEDCYFRLEGCENCEIGEGVITKHDSAETWFEGLNCLVNQY